MLDRDMDSRERCNASEVCGILCGNVCGDHRYFQQTGWPWIYHNNHKFCRSGHEHKGCDSRDILAQPERFKKLAAHISFPMTALSVQRHLKGSGENSEFASVQSYTV